MARKQRQNQTLAHLKDLATLEAHQPHTVIQSFFARRQTRHQLYPILIMKRAARWFSLCLSQWSMHAAGMISGSHIVATCSVVTSFSSFVPQSSTGWSLRCRRTIHWMTGKSITCFIMFSSPILASCKCADYKKQQISNDLKLRWTIAQAPRLVVAS